METFATRNEQYGNAYQKQGMMLFSLFPNGVTLKTADDFSRFSTLTMCASKISRYASAFDNGGHEDSAHDLITYAAMLEAKTGK